MHSDLQFTSRKNLKVSFEEVGDDDGNRRATEVLPSRNRRDSPQGATVLEQKLKSKCLQDNSSQVAGSPQPIKAFTLNLNHNSEIAQGSPQPSSAFIPNPDPLAMDTYRTSQSKEEKKKVVPIKIANEIVGPDYFEDLNINSGRYNINSFAGAETGDQVLELFLQNQALALQQRNIHFKKRKEEANEAAAKVAGLENWEHANFMARFDRETSIPPKQEDPAAAHPKQKIYTPPPNEIDLSNRINPSKLGDSHLSRQEKLKKKEQASFDFDKYEFYNENYQWPLIQFREKFRQAGGNHTNKQRVQRLLTELVYTQLVDRMNDQRFVQDKLPVAYRENQIRWIALMIRNHKFQGFFINFQNKLAQLMDEELAHNKDLFKMYLQHPRQSLSPQPDLVDLKAQQENQQQRRHTSHNPRDSIQIEYDPAHKVNLFPGIDPEMQLRSLHKTVAKGIVQAKFNFMQQQKRKREEQRKMVGSLKHVQEAINSGKSPAQAAKDINNKSRQAEVKKEMEMEIMKEFKRKAREKLEQKKEKAKQKNKNELTRFQKVLKQSARVIEDMVGQAAENNVDLKHEVNDCIFEVTELQDIKHSMTGENFVPGQKISRLVQEWADEDQFDPDDIDLWGKEYWQTLREFEHSLNKEEKGFELAYERLKIKSFQRINYFRQGACMRIEILESALIETKMKLKREVERAQMTIAEMESKALNEIAEQRTVDALIQRCNDGLVLRNIQEARAIIKDFLKIVKSKNADITNRERSLKDKQNMIEALQQRVIDKELFYWEEQRLRRYYQRLLLKLVRDLNIIQDPAHRNKFDRTIHEEDDDLNYQRQIHIILEELDLEGQLLAFSNKYYGHIEGLNKIQENLNLFGVAGGTNLNGSDDENLSLLSDSLSGGDDIDSLFQESEASSAQPRRRSSGGQHLRPQRLESKTIKSPKNDQVNLQVVIEDMDRGEAGPKQPSSPEPKHLGSPPLSKKKTPGDFTGGPKRSKLNKNLSKSLDLENRQSSAAASEVDKNEKPSKGEKGGDQGGKKKKGGGPKEQRLKKPPNAKRSSIQRKSLRGKQNVKDKILQQAARKQVYTLIKDALTGDLKDGPKITAETGKSQAKRNAARQNMTDMMMEIKPEELENFRFLDPNESKKVKATKRKFAKKQKKFDAKEKLEQILKQQNEARDEAEKNRLQKEIDALRQEDEMFSSLSDSLSMDSARERNRRKAAREKKQGEGSKNAQDEPLSPKSQTKSKSLLSKMESSSSVSNKDEGDDFGLFKINKEFDRMYSKKYKKLIEKSEQIHEDDPDSFKMKALFVKQMQDLVQASLNKELPYSQYMDLFQSDMRRFFEHVDELIVKEYKLQDAIQFAELGEQLQAEEEPKDKKQVQKDLKQVSFGDIIRPVFSKTAELIGFKIRPELVPMLYMNNKYDKGLLQKLVKTTFMLNRLLKGGKMDDFVMKQVVGGRITAIKEREFKDNEVQVTEEQIKEAMAALNGGNNPTEEEIAPETPREKALRILKDHMICLETRMQPAKKGYYLTIWEDWDMNQVLEHPMEDIYFDERALQERQNLTFSEYLTFLFAYIVDKVLEIGDEEERHILNLCQSVFTEGGDGGDFGGMGGRKARRKKMKVGTAQAVVPTRDQKTFTGNDLQPYPPETYVMKKAKNQLVLDKVMEEEFKKTIEMFDKFAECLSQIDLGLLSEKYRHSEPEEKVKEVKELFSDKTPDDILQLKEAFPMLPFDTTTNPDSGMELSTPASRKESAENQFKVVVERKQKYVPPDLKALRDKLQAQLDLMGFDVKTQESIALTKRKEMQLQKIKRLAAKNNKPPLLAHTIDINAELNDSLSGRTSRNNRRFPEASSKFVPIKKGVVGSILFSDFDKSSNRGIATSQMNKKKPKPNCFETEVEYYSVRPSSIQERVLTPGTEILQRLEKKPLSPPQMNLEVMKKLAEVKPSKYNSIIEKHRDKKNLRIDGFPAEGPEFRIGGDDPAKSRRRQRQRKVEGVKIAKPTTAPDEDEEEVTSPNQISLKKAKKALDEKTPVDSGAHSVTSKDQQPQQANPTSPQQNTSIFNQSIEIKQISGKGPSPRQLAITLEGVKTGFDTSNSGTKKNIASNFYTEQNSPKGNSSAQVRFPPHELMHSFDAAKRTMHTKKITNLVTDRVPLTVKNQKLSPQSKDSSVPSSILTKALKKPKKPVSKQANFRPNAAAKFHARDQLQELRASIQSKLEQTRQSPREEETPRDRNISSRHTYLNNSSDMKEQGRASYLEKLSLNREHNIRVFDEFKEITGGPPSIKPMPPLANFQSLEDARAVTQSSYVRQSLPTQNGEREYFKSPVGNPMMSMKQEPSPDLAHSLDSQRETNTRKQAPLVSYSVTKPTVTVTVKQRKKPSLFQKFMMNQEEKRSQVSHDAQQNLGLFSPQQRRSILQKNFPNDAKITSINDQLDANLLEQEEFFSGRRRNKQIQRASTRQGDYPSHLPTESLLPPQKITTLSPPGTVIREKRPSEHIPTWIFPAQLQKTGGIDLSQIGHIQKMLGKTPESTLAQADKRAWNRSQKPEPGKFI